jgi:glycosyltransferase involved in cell wall biosynthesis
MVTWVCNRATAFTAVSEQTAQKLFSMLPDDENLRNKLAIIPMGTALPKSLAAHKKRTGTINLFFIGRLVSIKGVDYLLRALANLKNGHDFRLTIGGDGQQREELEELTSSLGLTERVTFAGYVSGDVKDELFNAADIVCIPSIKEGENTEGLPVTLMEALANGKIVVASNVTGAQEYITNNVDGFIFQQGDTEDLRKVLESAFRLPEQEQEAVRKAAFELSRHFDWKTVAKKHVNHLFKEGSA